MPDVDGTRFPDLAVTDDDTATVHVIKPGLSITKTASPTSVQAGRDVTYTFVVTNTGDAALSNVVPVDDKCAPLAFTGGDDNDNGLLDGTDSGSPGELDLHLHQSGRHAAAARHRRHEPGRSHRRRPARQHLHGQLTPPR